MIHFIETTYRSSSFIDLRSEERKTEEGNDAIYSIRLAFMSLNNSDVKAMGEINSLLTELDEPECIIVLAVGIKPEDVYDGYKDVNVKKRNTFNIQLEDFDDLATLIAARKDSVGTVFGSFLDFQCQHRDNGEPLDESNFNVIAEGYQRALNVSYSESVICLQHDIVNADTDALHTFASLIIGTYSPFGISRDVLNEKKSFRIVYVVARILLEIENVSIRNNKNA